MKIAIAFLMFATQASTTAPVHDPKVGRAAVECGFFYATSKFWAPKATEQQRNATKTLELMMMYIAKENGTSTEEFMKILGPYQHKLHQHTSDRDGGFIRSEVKRCGALAEHEAEVFPARKQAGG